MGAEGYKKVVDAIAGKVGGQNDAPVGPIVLAGVLEWTVLAGRYKVEAAGGLLLLQQVTKGWRHAHVGRAKYELLDDAVGWYWFCVDRRRTGMRD